MNMPRNRGALSRKSELEATTGFEPVMGVLQTPALPLGYVASRPPRLPPTQYLVPRRGFEPLRPKARPPQDRVSASSTTSAQEQLIGRRRVFGEACLRLRVRNGRSGGTRTPDRRFWRPLLSQLSYTPRIQGKYSKGRLGSSSNLGRIRQALPSGRRRCGPMSTGR